MEQEDKVVSFNGYTKCAHRDSQSTTLQLCTTVHRKEDILFHLNEPVLCVCP